MQRKESSLDRPLRVLGFSETDPTRADGVANAIRHTYRHLSQHGHEALLVGPSQAAEPEMLAGFEVRRTTTLNLTTLDFTAGLIRTRKARHLIGEFEPDIVVAFSPTGTIGKGAVVAAQEEGVASLAAYMTDMPAFLRRLGKSAGSLSGVVERRMIDIHQRADHTAVPTSYSADYLKRKGVPDNKIGIWPRGVEAQHVFNPALYNPVEIADIRRQIIKAARQAGRPVSDETRIAGFVGRLSPEKLVERMTFIKATGAVGMVIGGGAEQYTRRLRREMGESVVFLGPKRGTELGKYMQAADFGVHFCEDDTWGQVVTEWMASAKPVLVPDKGAPQAVIRNQETGFVCQNPDDYARYTTVLTDNPDKLAEMSRLSRDLALTYTWKAAGAALVKNCYDAIDGSTVTSPNLALGRAA